ncbi:kinesin motor domain-containing protein, partial [Scheffersomyces amazonensis]|uniref:kinesin motor domain-containing protein n=1 Tax=Scheffersomyces amazonensis TaxID=1078765 RepID=UPI00315C9E67
MQRNAFPNNFQGSRIKEHRFVFDKLFDVNTSQNEVYHHTTRPLLDSILDGFNATVFAYGATGCGKTHTISGTFQDPGVIFLTMKELYQKIENLSDTKIIDISLSYLEIYNETIRDLLNPEIDHKKLILREDTNSKISVSNLSTHKPQSVEEVMDLILTGNQNRTSSPTEANATSSRSHAVLQINVTQKSRTPDLSEAHTFATLSIIDLAGSERAAATKNRGIRLSEGANINKSLLALGNCINALCDPRRRNHVPYRDSKLTRLLKFSLGGNCKTVMIVCVSPSSQHYDETLNTLKYANRAKEIKTKIVRNLHNLDRHVGSYLKMITEQKQEIEELRAREIKIEESITAKQKLINEKCFHLILENIENIKSSINKQVQERWKKYFILAKRKLLLTHKIELGVLLDGLLEQNSENLPTSIFNLCEQVIIKIDRQIPELEQQYSKPNDIDYILNDSSEQIIKRLKENEGWSDYHTLLFQKFLDSLKDSFDREILFNSSILYDHLIHSLNHYNFIARELSNTLSDNQENHRDRVVNNVLIALEDFVNGDFDSAVEKHTTQFMQQKLKDSDSISMDTSSNSISDDGLVLNSNTTIARPRDSKRGPISPLRGSPPRSYKRSISKKPITPKFSPSRSKLNKKVRWDIPRNDDSILDADASMDDHANTTLKSELEDDSPITNTILDSSLLNDDFGLKFDESVDSPPISSSKLSALTPEPVKHRKPRSENNIFNNRRLSINLNERVGSNTAPITIDNSSKVPLLNKSASVKLASNTDINPTFIPSGFSTSPKRFGYDILTAPTEIINNFTSIEASNGRDISSSGSEKV